MFSRDSPWTRQDLPQKIPTPRSQVTVTRHNCIKPQDIWVMYPLENDTL